MTGRPRIGVFGGRFDPPHAGHIAVAGAAMRQLRLDRLLIVPSRQPPHRDPGRTPPEIRYEMARAAFPGPGRVEVSRIELDRDGPGYTVETLEELAPEGRLFLIVGADHADLPGWDRPERVRELATLAVAPRPGAELSPRPGVVQLQMEPVELASTAIRRAACGGEDLGDLVPEAVAAVIATEGLYREGAC
jgi:nicotinate-nucleotide adenylyltransferase